MAKYVYSFESRFGTARKWNREPCTWDEVSDAADAVAEDMCISSDEGYYPSYRLVRITVPE